MKPRINEILGKKKSLVALKGSTSRRNIFSSMVLDNLLAVYKMVEQKDIEKIGKAVEKMNLKV